MATELQGARLGHLFASPLLEHVWSDAAALNGPLRDSILDHASRQPGQARSNVGGWHSEPGALDFCGQPGLRLIQHMRDMTQEATTRLYAGYAAEAEPHSWILSAWANVNRPGDGNNVHTHPSYLPHAVAPHRGDRPRISIAFNVRKEPFP